MKATSKLLQTLAVAAGLAATAQAALVVRTDTDNNDWLIQTSETAGSQTYEGNSVTSTVVNTGFTREVTGQPAYGFIQYKAAGAGAAIPATLTGVWTFLNLAAGQYDVATTFRALGASSVRYTVNSTVVFVDQSAQPTLSAGPSFTTNFVGDRPHDYNFTMIGSSVTVAEGGAITVTIDNSNTASTIAMDSVGITLVPEPSSLALLGLGGLCLLRRRRK